MRNAGLTLVAIALASCGRLDFDDLRDGGSRIDAPIAMLDSGTTDGTTDGSVMLSDAATDRANFIFMSSGTTTSGNLGGLAGADAFCQSAATTGGLTGTYVAMLMTSASNSSARFVGSRGWVDLHGKPIADQPSDLDGANLNPLAVDELGNTYSGASAYAWVGQHTSGTCMDWTSSADTTSVLAIDSSSTFNPDGFLGCSFTNARLICAEVGHVAPVVPAIATGRIAFITAASWMPGGGIGDADALCESEATSAGLVTGSYLAFLATSTATAGSRFTTVGLPWRRVDGTRITQTAADMVGSPPVDFWDTFVARTATGAENDARIRTGDATNNCNDWTSSDGAVGGAVGESDTTRTAMLDWFPTQPCSVGYPLMCLQQ